MRKKGEQEEHKVFLETSIQIERLLHTQKRKKVILKNLLHGKVYSSTYVLMEFKRSIIQDICYVCSIIETDCEPKENAYITLSDISRTLASGTGKFRYSSRKARRTYLVMAAILDEFPFKEVTKSEILEYLDFLIEQLQIEFREVSFSNPNIPTIELNILESAQPDLASVKVDCGTSSAFRCNRKNASCRCPQFLSQHINTVSKIAEAFKECKPNEQDLKMIKATKRVLHENPPDWKKFGGQKNCWPLGDTIIALEVPEDTPIYTKDRHFEIICPVIGKEVYRETRI